MRARADAPEAWQPARVAVAVRAVVLLLCVVLAALSSHPADVLPWTPLLLVAAAVGTLTRGELTTRLARVAEALLAVTAILGAGDATGPLYPYLVAPAFAGGLLGGAADAFTPPGFAGLALLAALPFVDSRHQWALSTSQWVLFAVAVGLLAAWVRRLLAPAARSPAEVPDASYAAAYRLLSQLRPVARQLSVGLDPGTIAQGLLQSLRDMQEFERGAVYVRTGEGRLVPLAFLGASRIDWEVDVAADGPFAEAWLSQRAQRVSHQLSGPPGSALVIPLVIGLRTFGLVGFESANRRLDQVDADQAAHLVEDSALRLETALLFDDVRGLATAEERRRVAREIHDGIAQELSYLGYFVDGLAAEARASTDTSMEEQLQQLRMEITRIVSELRMSIFDLRSEVDVHGGLGAALSEYVRSVGRQSSLTVHLSLAESQNRLPAETEAELLRIAQEAVTNARKHAEAENLWVSLTVDPPAALLRVEDDGRGLARPRSDSYGLQIMRERARRLRTTVSVLPRRPCGTVVEVRLGDDLTRLTPADSPVVARAEQSGQR